jgi:allophanate hydrolase
LAVARGRSAVDAFLGVHRLAELVSQTSLQWAAIDAFVLPTVPSSPMISDALTDPHGVNASLGRYTTFCNLLDLAAIAVPCEMGAAGLPVGVTFYGLSGSDALLAEIGAGFHAETGLAAGATGFPVLPSISENSISESSHLDDGRTLLAVVGAHRTGQALYPQLAAIGATYRETTWTSNSYRMYALPAPGVARPGLVKVETGGAPIEVEVHSVPVTGLGALLVQIPAPLALGRVELTDGRQITGFVCEGYAAATGDDVTDFGSWPAYLAR